MSQAMLRGLLAGACLAAARAQYGGCDLSTLPQQIQAVMTACCSDPSTCADGGLPTVCSGACSDVFEDFWGDCSSTIEMLGSSATGGMDLSRFDSVCKKGASSGGGGAGGKSVDCGYTSIMGLALVCDGDDIVGPDVFCSSDCYRALSPFMTECRAQLNPMMDAMIAPFISQLDVCRQPTPGLPHVTEPVVIPPMPADPTQSRCSKLAASALPDIESTCCAGSCTTMPPGCTHQCSDIFTPFYDDCVHELFEKKPSILANMRAMNALCTQAASPPPSPAPTAVEEPNHGVTAIVTQMFDNMVHTVKANRPHSGRYVTYQVELVLDLRVAANVYTIYGERTHEMEIPPAFQTAKPLGANVGGTNPAFFATQITGAADAKYDSWLSVGETTGNAGGRLTSIGILFDKWTLDEGLVINDGAVFWMEPDSGPSVNAVVAQFTVPVGTKWTAVFNCQGNSVTGPDYDAVGIMVNQDGQTGTEPTNTTPIPADQAGATIKVPGGGH